MSFHQFSSNQAPDVNSGKLEIAEGGEPQSFQGVRMERGEGIPAPEWLKIQLQIAQNEEAIQNTLAGLSDTFQYLPHAERMRVVNGFAKHWTGSDYALYDHFRTVCG